MLPKTISELNCIRDDCYSMVTKRAIASAGAAAVPVLGLDVAADVGMLMELIPAINRKFGLSKEQIDKLDSSSKAVILQIAKALGTQLVGVVITKELIVQALKLVGKRIAVKQVVKFIPMLGQATSAVMSYFAMKYVGDSHVEECYNVSLAYIQQMECSQEAQREAAATSGSSNGSEGEASKDIPALLRELKALHDEGIITKEEYERKKEELLSRY